MGGVTADHVNLWLGGLGSSPGASDTGRQRMKNRRCDGGGESARGGDDGCIDANATGDDVITAGGSKSGAESQPTTSTMFTRTQRHADQYDNVYVLRRGRKRFIVQPPTANIDTVAPVTHIASNGVHTTATSAVGDASGGTRSAPVEGALFDRVMRSRALPR